MSRCFVTSVGVVHCQCGRLGRAVEKVEGVMRQMTTVVAMVARCRVYSVNVLTNNWALNGAQMCQHGPCFPWQCLFCCSNGRRKANEQL